MRRSCLILTLALWALAIQGSAQPITSIAVGGSVADPDGRPVRGATVELVPLLSRFAGRELRLQGKAPEPVARTASGDDGRFEVGAPAPGMWEVRVTARGFVPRHLLLTPLLEARELPPLTMEEDVPLRLRVVGPQGRPVAGARVAAGEGQAWPDGMAWPPLPQLVTTGPNGGAVVSRWELSRFLVTATADGHPPVSLEIDPETPTAELRLAAGCRRTVQAVAPGADGADRPVAAAMVSEGTHLHGATDAAGRLDVAVRCDPEPRLDVETGDGRRARATPAAEGLLRAVLPAAPVRVSGLVLEEKTRRPLTKALVWPAADPGAFVQAGAKGDYSLPWTGDDESGLSAGSAGYLPSLADLADLADLSQPRTGAAGPTFLLKPGAVLRGVVVDLEDRPIPGVAVRSEAVVAGSSAIEEKRALTRADGSFSLSGLTPGGTVILFAARKGYAPADLRDVPVPAAEPPRLVLRPASRIAGRVVDEAGEPVADAIVAVFRLGGPSTMINPFGDRLGQAYSGDDGAFAIEAVEASKVRLTAQAEAFVQTEVQALEVVPGTDVEGLELVLRRGAVVTGRVTGPDGEPVEDARVRPVEGSPFETMVAFTDKRGRYRLEGMAEGAASFAASGTGFQRTVKDLEVRPGENRLDFTLEGGHEVSGRVVDAAGMPVAGARVTLAAPSRAGGLTIYWDSSGRPVSPTGADGTFRLTNVATGIYDVRAGKEGYAPGRLEAVEVAGRVEGLELRLDAGSSIQGRLVGFAPRDLTGLQVTAFSASPDVLGTAVQGTVEAGSRYQVSHLAPGDWQVMAVTSGGLRASGKVTVPPGEQVELDLELGGLTLTGRVLRAGKPVPYALVSASAPGTGRWQGAETTDAQGAFRFRGLTAGTWLLRVSPTYGVVAHEETLELSQDRDIVVSLGGERITGQVVNAADRSPLYGVQVSLEPGDGPPSLSLFAVAQRGTVSDETGAFTLADVGPGTYRLRARSDGYAPAEATVRVGNGEGVEGVMLALQPTEGLVLEVRGALGTPPSVVWVSLLDGDGRIVLAGPYPTGENGRVRVSSAPPGRWRLQVSAAGSGTAEQSVQVPGPAVRITLPPPTSR